MTPAEQMQALQRQLRAAEAARDALQAMGNQEQYLEAHGVVEALEKQLGEQLRPGPERAE